MPQIFMKSLRLAIWFFLPFAFTSYNSPDVRKGESVFVEGRYNLRTSGNQPMLLQGTIVFSSAIGISSKGKAFSTIKLDLENNENEKAHSLGFLISKQNWNEELKRGNYKVPVKIDGFIKNFEGVFGFANIKEMGELPFFAENGKINISYVGPKMLYGNLEVKLENSEGKQLNIRGDFTAIRKTIE